ncbi:MAG: cation transporter [Betaproteobacteria bacterium]|nr:cation transporter [Betaproteobacteria bacterium]
MSQSVSVSIVTNSLIAGSKFFGFSVTGSPTLFAETIHSLADVGNQVLLKVGEVRAGTKGDPEQHPFGMGQERFYWALVSAVSVFFLGCGVTLYHGISSLLHPEEVQPFTPLVIGLLFFALALELFTCITALREIGGWKGLRENRSNTTVLAVLAEDGVALLGILLTLFVALSSWYFGPHAVLDAIVSITVGIMLGAMAIWLANLNRRLLIDAGDSELNTRLEEWLASADVAAEVHSVTLDVDRYVVFIRLANRIPEALVQRAPELAAGLKAHARDGLGKRLDFVFWKFPAAA